MSGNNIGMSGGVSYGGINIGKSEGTVNAPQGVQKQGSTNIQTSGDIGNISTGDNHSGHMTALMGSTGQKKDPHNLTSAELLEQVRSSECSDETITIFEQNRVTGKVFMKTDLGELLDKLGIANEIDKMKLESLKKDLGEGL